MGVRERARIAELKARIAGRIAGARVEINLNTINVELLSDADLKAFLDRAKDRVERIRKRELDELIPDEDVERIWRSQVGLLVGQELGCHVSFEAGGFAQLLFVTPKTFIGWCRTANIFKSHPSRNRAETHQGA